MTSLVPTIMVCFPFAHPYSGKQGWGTGKDGREAFFFKRQFLHFKGKQRQSWLYINCLADTVTNLTGEEVLSPPFVLLLLQQTHG